MSLLPSCRLDPVTVVPFVPCFAAPLDPPSISYGMTDTSSPLETRIPVFPFCTVRRSWHHLERKVGGPIKNDGGVDAVDSLCRVSPLPRVETEIAGIAVRVNVVQGNIGRNRNA